MQLNKRYTVGEIDGGKLPYKHQIKKCRKNLTRSCLFAILCVIIAFLNVSGKVSDEIISLILTILFYVSLSVSILFYLIGTCHSKCCSCNRNIPIRRYNIGRIMSGQMPLCATCKLTFGLDFVEETR